MASPMQPILESFMALRDNSSRRAVLNEIIDNLSPYEIREVKSRVETVTFQCDLLDKLPLEIVAMVAEYLDLVDLILLQRVSKRWRQLLSSTIVVTSAIRHHMGKNAIKLDSSPTYLNALIRKRIRAERGLPAVVATIPNNLPLNSYDDLNRDIISCFNGVCAWIEESTDRTTIFMVHLPTGKNRTLTTANREEFTHVEVSDTLISATSVRGYCHVWNMPKEQYKSFRIPSLQFVHFITIGSKVALSYADFVVHFCFDSGVARSIEIGLFIVFLSVHPEEDEFSVLCIRKRYGDNIEPWGSDALLYEDRCLRLQKFSIHENKFVCIWRKFRGLPLKVEDSWEIQREAENVTPYRECLRPGESSALMTHCLTEAFVNMFSLSLDADGRIAVHFHPRQLDFKNHLANLDYSARGPGLIYCFEDLKFSTDTKLCIGYEFPELSHVYHAKGYQFKSKHTVVFPNNRPCTSILGDGDFVIFPSDNKVWIWCFDEAWLPSGIPDMRIATW
ncbi:uncharacterized protein N7479_004389 [Penicillium vulpinum]|uniref:F-box domain-containing protein n=1 Tax=Penicillium vulpinum TaxID=29845 RepID=A0A1V6SDL6_9EURO|nr:uncharacterized protein N7479_004389 [Penicillium vulpinum]KAJ5964513.1 hypothetical protein N7479_004389 [Penicillium vulpinum]OQE11794.1 hypothetical protein PENVUL_c002G04094 [Penicillium vulpinum]